MPSIMNIEVVNSLPDAENVLGHSNIHMIRFNKPSVRIARPYWLNFMDLSKNLSPFHICGRVHPPYRKGVHIA